MYKVFSNNILITLGNNPVPISIAEEILNISCENDHDALRLFLNEVLPSNLGGAVHLFAPDLKSLIEQFEGNFEIVSAAGGVVLDGSGNILLIFRRGNWDLPKGKVEPGESMESAAVREVEEETGVHVAGIESVVCETRHLYTEDGRNILKHTFWYKMKVDSITPELVPQAEEGIGFCSWFTPAEARQKIMSSEYISLRELVPLFL